MARRTLPLALLWPAGLVLLVGVLAFFQYRWLGQVSESERDHLRATMNKSARDFADDFDREPILYRDTAPENPISRLQNDLNADIFQQFLNCRARTFVVVNYKSR